MAHQITEERPVFLSTLPAGPGERRLALATILVSTLVFVAAAPFAKVPLGQVWAFIPIYESALVLNDCSLSSCCGGGGRTHCSTCGSWS